MAVIQRGRAAQAGAPLQEQEFKELRSLTYRTTYDRDGSQVARAKLDGRDTAHHTSHRAIIHHHISYYENNRHTTRPSTHHNPLHARKHSARDTQR